MNSCMTAEFLHILDTFVSVAWKVLLLRSYKNVFTYVKRYVPSSRMRSITFLSCLYFSILTFLCFHLFLCFITTVFRHFQTFKNSPSGLSTAFLFSFGFYSVVENQSTIIPCVTQNIVLYKITGTAPFSMYAPGKSCTILSFCTTLVQ